MASEKNATSLTKEEAVKWLSNLGLQVTGSKEELINKIKKYQLYPNLVKKLRSRTSRNRDFQTSLDPLSIPPLTAKWSNDMSTLPNIDKDIFDWYSSQKKEGSRGQQEKAYRMIQSRKIVSVKTLKSFDTCLFVKGTIKKSYGHQARPATILFEQGVPKKGYCHCPIGVSGLCCHILALLLFIKHYNQTGEQMLALTCTQQLQKWHRRSKGSIPMVPLNQIKLKSATKKSEHLVAADPEKSHFKRDVPNLIKRIQINIQGFNKPVSEHFHSVLSKSNIGRSSSYGEHICFKHLLNSLGDHQYLSQEHFDLHILGIPEGQKKNIENRINEKLSDSVISSNTKDTTNSTPANEVNINDIILQDELPIITIADTTLYENNPNVRDLCKTIDTQLQLKQNPVKIDICFLTAPKPSGNNYVSVEQNTGEWHTARKFKITGSRLPYLLGFNGSKKFDDYWRIVKTGVEDKNLLSNIENICRGQQYEKEALAYFEKVSKCTASECGFFLHPGNSRFGASPDALGPAGLLLEIKTRACNSIAPLQNLKDFANYYIQCQLQLDCTNAHSCILLSYHPETKTGNFFLIKKNHYLLNIIMDTCNKILSNSVITEWPYTETTVLQNLGEKIGFKKLDFSTLKPLRQFIKGYCDVPALEFTDEIEFSVN